MVRWLREGCSITLRSPAERWIAAASGTTTPQVFCGALRDLLAGVRGADTAPMS
ncbi:MAG: hypothetical protein JNK05_11790 [Myxococcales bacterium]|nr:hypothetical protein [Myxococcales bacterium]